MTSNEWRECRVHDWLGRDQITELIADLEAVEIQRNEYRESWEKACDRHDAMTARAESFEKERDSLLRSIASLKLEEQGWDGERKACEHRCAGLVDILESCLVDGVEMGPNGIYSYKCKRCGEVWYLSEGPKHKENCLQGLISVALSESKEGA